MLDGWAPNCLRTSGVASYGTAGREFIHRIVRAIGKDPFKFKARLDRRIHQFCKQAGISVDDAYEFRYARLFALAYAAGTFAID
jgi:hypothetical protein